MISTTCIVFVAVLGGFVAAIPKPGELPHIFGKIDNSTFNDCLASSNADREELNNMGADKHNNQELSEKAQCFLKCITEKKGLLNTDGTINMDELKNRPSPPHVTEEKKQKVEECMAGVKVSNCADIKQIHDCFRAGRN